LKQQTGISSSCRHNSSPSNWQWMDGYLFVVGGEGKKSIERREEEVVVVGNTFDCYFPVIDSQEKGGMKERAIYVVIWTFAKYRTCFILSPLHFCFSDFLSHFPCNSN